MPCRQPGLISTDDLRECLASAQKVWNSKARAQIFYFCKWHSHEPYSTCYSWPISEIDRLILSFVPKFLFLRVEQPWAIQYSKDIARLILRFEPKFYQSFIQTSLSNTIERILFQSLFTKYHISKNCKTHLRDRSEMKRPRKLKTLKMRNEIENVSSNNYQGFWPTEWNDRRNF